MVRRLSHKFRSLFLWHRMIGLVGALGAVWLAATGLLLAHGDDLGLETRFVRFEWLLNWYDMPRQQDVATFSAGGYVFSSDHHCLYLNSACLLEVSGPLVGAVATLDGILVASATSLQVLDQHGAPIENINEAQGLPLPIHRIGLDADGQLVLDGSQGTKKADIALSDWQGKPKPPIAWSTATLVSAEIKESIATAHRQRTVSWFRLVRDAHAGWLLGQTGRILMEVTAILILLLAVSGVGLWLSRLKKERRNKRMGSHSRSHSVQEQQ